MVMICYLIISCLFYFSFSSVCIDLTYPLNSSLFHVFFLKSSLICYFSARDIEEKEKWIDALENTILRHSWPNKVSIIDPCDL